MLPPSSQFLKRRIFATISATKARNTTIGSAHSLIRMASTTATSTTPVEDAIRDKLVAAFTPSTLTIRNDSHLHAHHAAMQGVASKETHFNVTITSESFQSKPQAARHRMIYSLLKDEMAREGGIHALQLRTRTLEEERKEEEQKQ